MESLLKPHFDGQQPFIAYLRFPGRALILPSLPSNLESVVQESGCVTTRCCWEATIVVFGRDGGFVGPAVRAR